MKILEVEVKRSYEFTYLIPGVYTNSEVKKVKDAVASLITKHNGEQTKEDDWGKKKLAYIVKKTGKNYDDAYYTHTTITFPSSEAQKFEKDIYLNQGIIRHLLVVAVDDAQGVLRSEKKQSK